MIITDAYRRAVTYLAGNIIENHCYYGLRDLSEDENNEYAFVPEPLCRGFPKNKSGTFTDAANNKIDVSYTDNTDEWLLRYNGGDTAIFIIKGNQYEGRFLAAERKFYGSVGTHIDSTHPTKHSNFTEVNFKQNGSEKLYRYLLLIISSVKKEE